MSKRKFPNPWNLAPMQVLCLRYMIQCGTNKKAAAELRLSIKTVSEHLRRAKVNMGCEELLHAILKWYAYAGMDGQYRPYAFHEQTGMWCHENSG